METVLVDGISLEGLRVATEKAVILAIKAANGFVGCGYFDVSTADKLGEHLAVVTGVSTFEEVLDAEVVKASQAALDAGVRTGMKGREALKIFNA